MFWTVAGMGKGKTGHSHDVCNTYASENNPVCFAPALLFCAAVAAITAMCASVLHLVSRGPFFIQLLPHSVDIGGFALTVVVCVSTCTHLTMCVK